MHSANWLFNKKYIWVINPVYLFLIGCKPAIALLKRVLFPMFFYFIFGKGEHGKELKEEFVDQSCANVDIVLTTGRERTAFVIA